MRRGPVALPTLGASARRDRISYQEDDGPDVAATSVVNALASTHGAARVVPDPEARHASQALQRRLQRLLRRRLVQGGTVTTLASVAFCGLVPRKGVERPGMRLRQRLDGSRKASKVDVGFCKSKCCPHCLPAEAQDDMRQLWLAGVHVMHSGGSLLHLTTTAQHSRTDSLATTIDRVQAGWEYVLKSRLWHEVRTYGVSVALRLARVRDRDHPDGQDEHGDALCKRVRDAKLRVIKAEGEEGRLWAWAAARENTWGNSAGHHPHQHGLIFLREQVSEFEARELQHRVLQVYRAGLEKVGATCDDAHGVKIEIATTRRDAEEVMAKYVTKICLEVTRGDRKVPTEVTRWVRRRDGELHAMTEVRFTPWDWLRAIAEDNDFVATGDLGVAQKSTRRYIHLWREYEQATAGKARLTHGGDWKELLAEAEECEHQGCVDARHHTAEEETTTPLIPGEDEVTEDTPDTIDWPKSAHRLVMDQWDEFASLAETCGWAPVLNELTRQGVDWRWRRPGDDPVVHVDDDGPPECWTWESGEMMPTEFHQSGACTCWDWLPLRPGTRPRRKSKDVPQPEQCTLFDVGFVPDAVPF
jgi:hypothetical protein